MSVILPNICADPKDIVGPLFFFAGPVQGGGDWQYECYKKIAERLGEKFCAAIPMRYQPDHPLMKLRLPSSGHLLLWGRFYLEEAGARFFKPNCIIFYLARESVIAPRADGLPYAMDTRGELGEWRGRLMYDSRIRLIIGADPEFPGLDTITRNFEKALRYFTIHKTLDETVAAAIKLVTKEE